MSSQVAVERAVIRRVHAVHARSLHLPHISLALPSSLANRDAPGAVDARSQVALAQQLEGTPVGSHNKKARAKVRVSPRRRRCLFGWRGLQGRW